jgi:hypothetical protein
MELVELHGYIVDQAQAALSLGYGDRHGAIQADDWRVMDAQQRGVQIRGLGPIGRIWRIGPPYAARACGEGGYNL